MKSNLSPKFRHHGFFRAAPLFIVAAGLVFSADSLAIVGGELDESDHPYVGAIDSRAHGAAIVTSGVLISSTVLLTAGHVTRRFDSVGLTQARVTFDPVVSQSSSWYTGTIHTNPAYDPTSADDPGDLGVIVFDTPIPGITPALLPTANLLDPIERNGLSDTTFNVVGFGVSEILGGENGGGQPHPDLTSGGTRKVASQSFLSLTRAWIRLGLHENGATCAGDSGAPSLLGDSDVIASINIGSPSGCKNVTWDMRVDTPATRAFLGSFVNLP